MTPEMITETVTPCRVYRVADPGSAYVLPVVEMSDDGVTWRVTPNHSRRALAHYRIHRVMPPGFDSGQWAKVKPLFDAALAAGWRE